MGETRPVTAPAGRWSFACPDWKDKLRRGATPIADLPINPQRAARAIKIYDRLRLPDVIGQPPLSEAGAQWFRDIVGAAFGSVDDAGARHVPEIFLEVPKKNSKTTNAAALTLVFAILNKRPLADMMLLGPTQAIADTGFSQAVGMIRADPDEYLQKRFKIRDHNKTIEDLNTGAKIAIRTFDPDVVTGKKPILVVIDELHLLGMKHEAARVIRQLRGGMLPFAESLLVFITTQSDLPPAGVFKQELQQARAIRDGKGPANARMLPVLYEFPEEMQTDKSRPWLDVGNWPMVLPNLNKSITLKALVDDFEGERDKGEEAIRLWASQHLNVEIGLALHSRRWRGADFWEAAAVDELTLEILLERSEVVTVGIDAGGLDDLFAIAVVGRCRRTRRWLYWSHAWVDPSVLELRKDIAPTLQDIAAAGDLTFAETTMECIQGVISIVQRIRAAGLFPKEQGIGADPYGIGALLDALKDADFGEPLLTAVAPQSYKLSSAIWSMERMLKDRAIEHGGQPLMTFAVGNAAAELRGNNIHITKQTAGRAKIDPLIACFIATKLIEANPQASSLEYQMFFVGDDEVAAA